MAARSTSPSFRNDKTTSLLAHLPMLSESSSYYHHTILLLLPLSQAEIGPCTCFSSHVFLCI